MKNNSLQPLLIIAFTFHSALLLGQSFKASMYDAYLSDNNSKEKWVELVRSQSSRFRSNPGDKVEALNFAIVQFGLLNSTMRDKDKDLFDEYVDQMEETCEDLIKQNKNWAEPKALLSATYGLIMGYSPWKGMFLGSKSNSLVERSLKDDPESPLAWSVFANSKLHTPEMWGGDVNEAVTSYEKAIQLYESDETTISKNWLYLNSLAFLGIAYQKQESFDKAISTFNKALEYEPNFGWIKFVLLPAAQKAKSSN